LFKEDFMLTAAHLEQIMQQASRSKIAAFLEHLQAAMRRFGVDATLERAAAFIAQLAHESGQFQFMEEIWGPTLAQKRYEPVSDLSKRLGNTQKGDGFRFKGRGPIQVTGRFNYQQYGEALGIDLVSTPELAATPSVGFAIAGLYWDRNGLNALADRREFATITKRINGGLNGQAERVMFYERALAVLASVFPLAAAFGTRRRSGSTTGSEGCAAQGQGPSWCRQEGNEDGRRRARAHS
jgi:predicted chitinase